MSIRLSRILPLLFLFCSITLQAQQQCIQGWDDNAPQDPPFPTSYVWTNDFVALTRLGNLYMPSYGDGDSMTEPFALNGGMVAPFGSDGFRETWYVPRDSVAVTTAPFYRLIGGTDHMDSDNTNEASPTYHSEMTLGYPYTSQQDGTVPLTRYFKPSIFDHRLFFELPVGYSVDKVWNGASGVPARYAYPRFGNKLQWCDVDAMAFAGNSIANTKLQIDFNKVWGNAIGRIWWKGTNPWTQLVREQIGAMVQSTIFNTVPNPNDPEHPYCCDYNPTQSGGIDLKNGGNTRRWAGSPTFNNSFPTGTSHVTEVKPFNFSFTEWVNTDPYSPLMWRGTFKKTTTLGFNIAGTVYQDVFLMRFEAKRDNASVKATAHNMNNTYWLTMNPLGDGNTSNFHIDMVNLDTGALQAYAHPPGRFDTTTPPNQLSNNTIALPADGRGVLLSSNNGAFAMGFHTPNGPDNFHLMYWCDGGAVTNGNCSTEFQTIVYNTFDNQSLGTSYDFNKRQDTYMVVGTKADVIRRLKQIKCALNGGGAACNNIL